MYKDKEKQKQYQKNWIAARRFRFFSNKTCGRCGGVLGLELHHTDPDLKTNHRIWSWSAVRRQEELSKCQILCQSCHQKETSNFRKAKTKCKQGHEYTPKNTYLYKGNRQCRECKNYHNKYGKRNPESTAKGLAISLEN